MSKFPGVLLTIVFSTLILQNTFADEQVRQLQEELRKRHLYFDDPDGEFTPALSAAISRYQKKKGFPITGAIDPITRASLRLPELVPRVAPTPFVVIKPDDVRGGNGELLPGSTPLFSPLPNGEVDEPSRAVVEETVPPTAESQPDIQSPAEGRPKRSRPKSGRSRTRKSTNPFVLAYQSVDHAVKLVLYDTQPKVKRAPKKRS